MKIPKAHLYVPGDSERKVLSAAKLDCDSIILDLEDGVAENHKDLALASLAPALEQLAGRDVWVRLNAEERGLRELKQVSELQGLSGVWIPKAQPSKVFTEQLQVARESGLQVGILIESALGYIGRNDLMADPVVRRVQLGEYDLRGDLGLAEDSVHTERDLDPIRIETVVSAVAANIEVIVSGVSSNFTDLERFTESCQKMKNLGFNGRAVIHPSQVSISHDIFSAGAEEIERARKLLAQFSHQLSNGVGAYRDQDGNMADAATIRRAQRVIDQLS
jgi:citrate lyase subunit beta/citryl-CoA lyase